jgi:hypothetical protein
MIKKKIFQIAMSLGLLPLCASADESYCLIPGEPICDQIAPGYFYPALYETCGCLDIAVSADFIYWAANKQVNSFAIEHDVSRVPDFTENIILTHRFGYRPGFKVGVDLGFRGFDSVVAHSEYMRFNNTTTTSRTAPVGSFITPLNGVTTVQAAASRVSSKWHFNAQWAELTVGRPLYLGQRLILLPFFGLKAFWFHQNQRLQFDLLDGTLGTIRNACHIWAVGPYINIGARGLICGGFYALMKMGITLPYARYTKNDFSSDLPNTVSYQQNFFLGKKKPYTFQALFDAGAGLGWGTTFCSQSYHLNFELTYDYWSGLLANTLDFGGYLAKDLYLQGLTVKAQFDF